MSSYTCFLTYTKSIYGFGLQAVVYFAKETSSPSDCVWFIPGTWED